MALFCVYCHTAPDGRRYIGITSRKPEKRWNYGKGYSENTYFTRAIEKYGWNNFKHEILMEGLTIDEASDAEIRLIKEYRSAEREFGFNLELGGLNGRKMLSEETKRKIGDSHRGRYTEKQWEATRRRMGKGHPHTEEAKKKIGDAHRGRKMSEAQRKLMSETRKGKCLSEKTKEKLKATWEKQKKKVIMFDMDWNEIRTYDSMDEAGTDMHIKPQCISACCRGKCSHAGHYKWKYAEGNA